MQVCVRASVIISSFVETSQAFLFVFRLSLCKSTKNKDHDLFDVWA